MSEIKNPETPTPEPNSFVKSETYPKIVVMHGNEDEFRKQLWDVYAPLYVKLHDVYTTEHIFSLAHKAATDFEGYLTELKTHVNVNFEEEIRKHVGEEAVKELKRIQKEKEQAKRRNR